MRFRNIVIDTSVYIDFLRGKSAIGAILDSEKTTVYCTSVIIAELLAGALGAREKEIIIKDMIADAFLQQILLRPEDYAAIATLNLNGDYMSDALAAQVGGIGIAPGANLSDTVAIFEATHGTAPKYAGENKVNPGSLILSAEMMLRHLGWVEAADLIIQGVEAAIEAKTVTYDFQRMMKDATLLSTSEFGKAIVDHFS